MKCIIIKVLRNAQIPAITYFNIEKNDNTFLTPIIRKGLNLLNGPMMEDAKIVRIISNLHTS